VGGEKACGKTCYFFSRAFHMCNLT
jgi:hypothetical protein